MEGLHHERHDQDDGGFGLLHVGHDVAQALTDSDGAAAVKRTEIAAGTLISVVQGQDRQEGVIFVDINHGAHAHEVLADIFVAQHDGLGIGGRPRCKEQNLHGFRIQRQCIIGSVARFDRLGSILEDIPEVKVGFILLRKIEPDVVPDAWDPVTDTVDDLFFTLGEEENIRLGAGHQVNHFIGGLLLVKGHDHG